jgi:predicted amidohydrolase YtcJ
VLDHSFHAEPTGLLIDSAMELVVSQIPALSIDDRRDALQKASSLALTRGVTTVVDVGRYYPGMSADLSWEDFTGFNVLVLVLCISNKMKLLYGKAPIFA